MVKEKEGQAEERMSVFLLTTMMMRIEGGTLEPKKQYEVLLDDSVNTMVFRDKNEASDQVQTQNSISYNFGFLFCVYS